jgi:hypothetical protein
MIAEMANRDRNSVSPVTAIKLITIFLRVIKEYCLEKQLSFIEM